MFVQNSNESRQFFIGVRNKLVGGEILQPLESMVATILSAHPEYDDLLADQAKALSDEYISQHYDMNPFLHLSLHLALQEQLDTNRPTGIKAIFQNLKLRGFGDEHFVRHKMMECLAESLYKAQMSQSAPDQADYLRCLKSI
ncbi:MAG: DUF1841 family protein [Pseudomonadota bacterium]